MILMALNIGIIGVGTIGNLHLHSLKQINNENLLSDNDINIKVRGVADVDPKKLHSLKQNSMYDIEYFTMDPNEIIKDKEIDIIYITSPTRFHKDHFIQAAEEGKNIFCEKPLAFFLKDIREMIHDRFIHRLTDARELDHVQGLLEMGELPSHASVLRHKVC